MKSGAILLDEEGRIQSVDTRASELLGIAETELLGWTVAATRIDLALSRHKLGLACFQPAGLQGKTVCVVHETTEKAALREEQERLETQLAHVEKLAAIGALAASVAHEIKNALAILKGFTGLLGGMIGGVEKPEETRRVLGKISGAIDRINVIVNGLRTFSRATGDQMEEVDLGAVLDEAVTLFSSVSRKAGIEYKWKKPENPVPVNINTGKFQQVILNLVSNARDAIQAKGTGGVIELVCAQGLDGSAQVTVIDSGCGIPRDSLERVFEPFFTTKSAEQGTGLGLSIVRSIMKSFGGDLEIFSSVGVGTRVALHFPGPAGGTAPAGQTS